MTSPAPPSSRSRSRPTSHQPAAGPATTTNGTGAAPAAYAQGYQPSVLAAHAARTASSSAAYLLPHLTALSARQPRLRILDVGCGPGSITVDLAARFPLAEVVGLEPAEGAAALDAARELARERGVTNVRFVVGNVHSLVSSLDDPPPARAAAAGAKPASKAPPAADAAAATTTADGPDGDGDPTDAADATGAADGDATGAATVPNDSATAEPASEDEADHPAAAPSEDAADSKDGDGAGADPAADATPDKAETASPAAAAAPPAPTRFAPGSFDVVHAHEVLQHCGDPVGALRQMRRVCRWGGCVAVRTADMGTIEYAPAAMPAAAAGEREPDADADEEDTRTPTGAPDAAAAAVAATATAVHPVKAWQKLFLAVIFASGGEPRAGRLQSAWAREAGLDAAKMLRSWGAQQWDASPAHFHAAVARHADRLVHSSFAATALRHGLASPQSLQHIADGFRAWGALDGARISILEGEMVCFV